MRKFTAFLLALILALPFTGSIAYGEEASKTAQMAALMKDLEIMSGDENGNLNLDNAVTRAEFAKMVISASQYKNSVSKTSITSPFHDVPFTYWGASYIRTAAKVGYIKGYPDSTFRPENNVTLEEGVTIVLKLLGYGDDYFDLSWPNGQMNAASNLELLEGVDSKIGQPLKRRDVLQLIYNALTTNMNGKTTTLLNSFGYTYIDDVILIATSDEDSSISANKIITSAGTFKIESDFDKSLSGYKGELVLKNQDTVVTFLPSNVRGAQYTLNTILNDDVLVYDGNKTTSVNIGTNTSIYYKTEKTTLSGAKSKASIGDSVSVYTNYSGDIEYVMIGSSAMTGPITVLSDLSVYGINDSTSIYKNGKSVSKSDINTRDILYYSKAMNVAWVYSNKITGVYENALPNQDNIESVVISGKTYTLESTTAYEKLVTGGSVSLGDSVTIYLGRNGEIADVYEASSENSRLTGYLVATGTKQYKNSNGNEYSSYYATVAFADGNEIEYKTERNYKDYICSLVNVTFNADGTKISKVATGNNTLSGQFNASLNTLGSARLADDVKIMDIATTDTAKAPSYVTVYKQRLDGAVLTSGQILSYERNSDNEISALYLNNATGDNFRFGIVTDVRGTAYTLNLGGLTVSAVNSTSLTKGRPVKAIVSGAGATSIQKLTEVPETYKGATQQTLTFGEDEYRVYDKIAVFERVATGQWQTLTYADFLSGPSPKSVQAYYDKPESNGGRIRVLVITR